MRAKSIHYEVPQIIPTPLSAQGPLSPWIWWPR